MQETIIGILCTIAGTLIGFASYRRAVGKEGERDGKAQSDIEYIKRRTDDILLEQRNTNITLGTHAERITRVEESVKQAHKRINELTGGSQ